MSKKTPYQFDANLRCYALGNQLKQFSETLNRINELYKSYRKNLNKVFKNFGFKDDEEHIKVIMTRI